MRATPGLVVEITGRNDGISAITKDQENED
jgi:hypothetical protein